jgi:parafibromin
LIVSYEVPVGTTTSVLRAANPKKDLSKVLEIFHEAEKASNAKNKPSLTNPSGSSPMRKHLLGKKPVIIVPKGMTAPITMANAHEFLCHGRYVPRDVMLQRQRAGAAAGGMVAAPTTFTRTVKVVGGESGGGGGGNAAATALVEYEIMDNPKKLGSIEEWDRIVAVFVLGQSWQFKDWAGHYKDPVQLFARTYGYIVSLEGDKIPPESMGWNIVRGKLNRDKRGLDSVTYAQFWSGLDEFMNIHKRELLPSV